MIEGSLNHRSSVIAKASYRAANRMIHLQCQRGRPFPSRLTLKMLQFAADQGHVPAMSRLGALLYQWGVGRAVKRSGLEYIRMAAKGGDATTGAARSKGPCEPIPGRRGALEGRQSLGC